MNYDENYRGTSDRVEIDSLVLIRNNGYVDQYIRPYTTNFTSFSTQERFKNAVEEFVNSRSSNDMSFQLAQEFSEVIKLRNAPGPLARIPRGWGEPRAQYIMLVSYTPRNGLFKERYIVQGYTDHCDIGERSGNYVFDPNMTFFVNSITAYNEMISTDRTSSTITKNNTFSVLRDMDKAYSRKDAYYQPAETNDSLVLMRPTDIHLGISIEKTNEDSNDYEYIQNQAGLLTASDEQTTSRQHEDPLNYLTNIVNTYKIGELDAMNNYNGTSGYLTNNAAEIASNISAENHLRGNRFLRKLLYSSNAVTSTMFTVSELNLAFDNFLGERSLHGNRIMVVDNEASDFRAYNIESNLSTDPEYIKCLELLQTTVAVASSYGITDLSLGFKCIGNVDRDVKILKLESPIFKTMSDRVYMTIFSAFERKFVDQCLERYCGLDFDLAIEGIIDINTFGESVININYAPHIPDSIDNIRTIIIPSFADSLFSTCIGEARDKRIIVNDLNNALDFYV